MSDITVQNVILSYPHLFEPWGYKPEDPKKYAATLIFPKEYDFSAVTAAINSAIAEKWPSGTPANLQMPWKIVPDGVYEGCHSFTAKDDKHQPDVVDTSRNPIIDPRKVFAGCKIHCAVRFYGTTAGGSPRVAVGLGPIMVVDNSENMPRLAAGGITVDDAFAGIAGAPTPTAAAPGQTAPGGPASPGAPNSSPLSS